MASSFRPSEHTGLTRQGCRSLDDPETLRALARHLPGAIYISSERGEILDANPAFLDLVGVASLEALSAYPAERLVVDPAIRRQEIAMLDRDGVVREFELQLIRPDGELRTVLDTAYVCYDSERTERFYHGVLIDISTRKELEIQLIELSLRDPLTGCYNRRYMTELERRLIARPDSRWGCLYIDIDHFKQYNDRFGHAEGDEVLVRMSRFLARQVRADEVVMRVGGDEFVVALAGADDVATEQVARRLQRAALYAAPVPFSLGWTARTPPESFEHVVSRADRAMLAVRVVDRAPELQRRERP